MGFFDKVKNMFTEEVEDDEVKVQQIKKDVTHVAIDSPVKEDSKSNNDYNFSKEMSFSKPIFFDEDDFDDLDLVEKKKEEKPKLNETKKEKEKPKEKQIYVGNSILEKEEKKIFKPTPIISPVYGILDKNYHKEDIIDRSDVSTGEIKEDSIDSIRDKAYGTLEDELENTLFGNSILFKKDEEEIDDDSIDEIDEDSISSLTEDVSKELDNLLENKKKAISSKPRKKTKEKINLEEEKIESEEDEDLLGFIDSTLYKDGDEQ